MDYAPSLLLRTSFIIQLLSFFVGVAVFPLLGHYSILFTLELPAAFSSLRIDSIVTCDKQGRELRKT